MVMKRRIGVFIYTGRVYKKKKQFVLNKLKSHGIKKSQVKNIKFDKRVKRMPRFIATVLIKKK